MSIRIILIETQKIKISIPITKCKHHTFTAQKSFIKGIIISSATISENCDSLYRHFFVEFGEYIMQVKKCLCVDLYTTTLDLYTTTLDLYTTMLDLCTTTLDLYTTMLDLYTTTLDLYTIHIDSK